MPPLKLIPTVNKKTVSMRLQPVYETTAKHIAGPNWPMVLRIFLVTVMLNLLVVMSQSAIIESSIEEIHIPR